MDKYVILFTNVWVFRPWMRGSQKHIQEFLWNSGLCSQNLPVTRRKLVFFLKQKSWGFYISQRNDKPLNPNIWTQIRLFHLFQKSITDGSSVWKYMSVLSHILHVDCLRKVDVVEVTIRLNDNDYVKMQGNLIQTVSTRFLWLRYDHS